MTGLDALRSPLSFLESRLEDIPHGDVLDAEESWWKSEGIAISDAIDRAGTPWLLMFNRPGERVDQILYPREYQTILRSEEHTSELQSQSNLVCRLLLEKKKQ